MKFFKVFGSFLAIIISIVMFFVVFSTNVLNITYNAVGSDAINDIVSDIDIVSFIDEDVSSDVPMVLESPTMKRVFSEIISSGISSQIGINSNVKFNKEYVYKLIDDNIDKILSENNVSLSSSEINELVKSLKDSADDIVLAFDNKDNAIYSMEIFGIKGNILINNYLLVMVVIIVILFLLILLFKFNFGSAVNISGNVILVNGIVSVLLGVFMSSSFISDFINDNDALYSAILNPIVSYFKNGFVRNGIIMLIVGIVLIIVSILDKRMITKKNTKHIIDNNDKGSSVEDVNHGSNDDTTCDDNTSSDVNVSTNLEETMEMKTFAERVHSKEV